MAEQKPLVIISGDIQQLPPGDTISGVPGSVDTVFATRVDFVGKNLIYKGWAVTGSIESAAVWKISKTIFVGSDDDVTVTWADGDSNLDNIWDDRATLSYS